MVRPRNEIKPQEATPSRAKAWLLGFLAGDGTVKKTARASRVSAWAGLEKTDADECVRVFDEVFGAKATVEVYGPGHLQPHKYEHVNYNVVCSWVNVVDDILSFGPFGVSSWRIPEKIKTGGPEDKGAWLRGFFDADGRCRFRGGALGTERTLAVTSTNRAGIRQVKELLSSLGIQTVIYKHVYKEPSKKTWNDRFDLQVLGRRNIETFSKKVGFRNPKKAKALEDCLSSFKHSHAIDRGAGVKILPEILALRARGYSLKQVAKALNLRGPKHAQEIVQRAVKRGEISSFGRSRKRHPRSG